MKISTLDYMQILILFKRKKIVSYIGNMKNGSDKRGKYYNLLVE